MLIEIDSRCNLNCKTCPRKTRKGEQGAMSMELFKECIDKLIPSQFDNFIFPAGFGESLMNENFFDMMRYAKRNGCRIMMPTNGTLINEDNIKYLRLLDTIQFSIDSLKDIDRRTTDPKHILNLIPSLKKYGIRPFFNVTLGTSNWHEIQEFIMFGLKYGVIINFITPRPLDPKDTFLMDEMKFVASHAAELQRLIEPYPDIFYDDSCRTFQKCKVLNYDFAVAWNGDLYPCSAAFFQDYTFGNVRDFQAFDDFWKTDEMVSVGRGKHPVCDYCKAYDKVWNESFKQTQKEYTSEFEELRKSQNHSRCFILGTGRSITENILKKLSNELTIGVNGIAYAKALWELEPDYICLSDHTMLTHPLDFEALKQSNSKKILSEFIYYHALCINVRSLTDDEKTFLSTATLVKWKNPGFKNQFWLNSAADISFDIEKGTHVCGNVIQDLAIPLSVWLGCKEIYLLGCDCDNSGHFYDPKEDTWRTNEPSIYQYKFFKERLDELNIPIYNLSPSKIPGIENKELDEIIK